MQSRGEYLALDQSIQAEGCRDHAHGVHELIHGKALEDSHIFEDLVGHLRTRNYSPYDRPITSSMISSVPAPIRLRRMSRHARSTPYSFM